MAASLRVFKALGTNVRRETCPQNRHLTKILNEPKFGPLSGVVQAVLLLFRVPENKIKA